MRRLTAYHGLRLWKASAAWRVRLSPAYCPLLKTHTTHQSQLQENFGNILLQGKGETLSIYNKQRQAPGPLALPVNILPRFTYQ